MTSPNEKIDYERDGLCFANSCQQRDCKNYEKYKDSIYSICRWQSERMACDYEEGE